MGPMVLSISIYFIIHVNPSLEQSCENINIVQKDVDSFALYLDEVYDKAVIIDILTNGVLNAEDKKLRIALIQRDSQKYITYIDLSAEVIDNAQIEVQFIGPENSAVYFFSTKKILNTFNINQLKPGIEFSILTFGFFTVSSAVVCTYSDTPNYSIKAKSISHFSNTTFLSLVCSFKTFWAIKVTWFLNGVAQNIDYDSIFMYNHVDEKDVSFVSMLIIKLSQRLTLLGRYTCEATNDRLHMKESSQIIPVYLHYQNLLGKNALKPSNKDNSTKKIFEIYLPKKYEYLTSNVVLHCTGLAPLKFYAIILKSIKSIKSQNISFFLLKIKPPDSILEATRYDCQLSLQGLIKFLPFSIEICKEGNFVDGEFCLPCPEGKWSNSSLECYVNVSFCKENYYGYGTSCSLCRVGHTTNGVTNATNIEQCVEQSNDCGKLKYGMGTNCLYCPRSQISGERTAVKLEDCYTPNNLSCPDNHYGWEGNCSHCPNGTSAPKGVAVKENDCFANCAASFYGSNDSCLKCPNNSISTPPNNLDLTSCVCTKGLVLVNQSCQPNDEDDEMNFTPQETLIYYAIIIILILSIIIILLIYFVRRCRDPTSDEKEFLYADFLFNTPRKSKMISEPCAVAELSNVNTNEFKPASHDYETFDVKENDIDAYYSEKLRMHDH